MKAYTFTATCHDCEGLLHPVTHSRPIGTESRAVARCTECGCEWLISTFMRRLGRDMLAANRQARQARQREREVVSA